MIGKQFHSWTVVSFDQTFKGKRYWIIQCQCGFQRSISTSEFNVGTFSKECKQCRKKKSKSYTKTYRVWNDMKKRCANPNHPSYHNYGGRGIDVCDRWKYSYDNFLTDMGERPSNNHSLDRIDNNDSYTPGNCRWATLQQQANNKSTTVQVTYQGKTQSIKQWSNEYNIPYSLLRSRLQELNWPIKKALTTPVGITKFKGNSHTLNGASKPLTDWCKEYNIAHRLVYKRIKEMNWDIEKALTTPARKISLKGK